MHYAVKLRWEGIGVSRLDTLAASSGHLQGCAHLTTVRELCLGAEGTSRVHPKLNSSYWCVILAVMSPCAGEQGESEDKCRALLSAVCR